MHAQKLILVYACPDAPRRFSCSLRHAPQVVLRDHRTGRMSGMAPGRGPHRAYRHQVTVGYLAHIARMKCHEGLRAARRGDELDLNRIRREHLYNGPKIAGPETVRRNVVSENNDVEGCSVMATGRSGPLRIARIVHAAVARPILSSSKLGVEIANAERLRLTCGGRTRLCPRAGSYRSRRQVQPLVRRQVEC